MAHMGSADKRVHVLYILAALSVLCTARCQTYITALSYDFSSNDLPSAPYADGIGAYIPLFPPVVGGTLATCESQCQANVLCRAFTWNGGTQTCYYKSVASAATLVQLSDTTVTTGAKTDIFGFVTYAAADFGGNDITSYTVDSADTCGLICFENLECQAFTFNYYTSLCWIKSAATWPPADISDPLVLTALKSSQMTTAAGYDYSGNDYANSLQPTLNACQGLCLTESECQAFTYNGNTQVCYLKTVASATSLYATGNNLDVTGQKFGSTAFAMAPGKDFSGNDLPVNPLTAITPAQCASLCTATAGCAAFTYNPYTSNCYVKSLGDQTTVKTLSNADLVVVGTAYTNPCDEAWPRIDFTAEDVLGYLTLAITFDDGPDCGDAGPNQFFPDSQCMLGQTNEEAILDGLKLFSVRSTFFTTTYGGNNAVNGDQPTQDFGGPLDAQPVKQNTIRRVVNEGHVIADHSVTHSDYSTITAPAIDFELGNSSADINKYVSPRISSARTPYGTPYQFTAPNTSTFALVATEVAKYAVHIGWTAAGGSGGVATPYDPVATFLNYLVDLEANTTGVELFHSVYNGTSGAVPLLIQYGRLNGYRFVTSDYYVQQKYGMSASNVVDLYNTCRLTATIATASTPTFPSTTGSSEAEKDLATQLYAAQRRSVVCPFVPVQ